MPWWSVTLLEIRFFGHRFGTTIPWPSYVNHWYAGLKLTSRENGLQVTCQPFPASFSKRSSSSLAPKALISAL
jgi:hypothetical protein